MNAQRRHHYFRDVLTILASAALMVATNSALAAPPDTPISDVPLTLVQPTHPEVLILLGNSQSMDGDLSGA
ncbi:MAG TPA: hypothetical protein VFM97_04640, partial [Gammaproteobacteria bacterium]|nr:hypothetical protein [Gammaproteobacteria bacterium]